MYGANRRRWTRDPPEALVGRHEHVPTGATLGPDRVLFSQARRYSRSRTPSPPEADPRRLMNSRPVRVAGRTAAAAARSERRWVRSLALGPQAPSRSVDARRSRIPALYRGGGPKGQATPELRGNGRPGSDSSSSRGTGGARTSGSSGGANRRNAC